MKQRMMRQSVLLLLLAISIAGARCKPTEGPANALPRAEPFNSTTQRGFSGSSTSVVVTVGNTTSDFKVSFAGLIVHANYDKNGTENSPRRAMLVQGKQGMEHEPLLILAKPADSTQLSYLEADLNDGAGHPANCSDSRYPNRCIVDLTGVAMRIRGDNDSMPNGPLAYDNNTKSFTKIVPSIKKRASGTDSETDIKPGLMQQLLPTDPVAAYFEIDGGGTLLACPFSQGGHFSDEPSTASNQFASDVHWVGQTTGPAVLELAHTVDNNQHLVWKYIRTANTGLLKVGISNEPKPPVQFSTAHFQLFDQVLNGGSVLTITASGRGPQCPQGCLNCSSFPQVVIPGCSDSQWP